MKKITLFALAMLTALSAWAAIPCNAPTYVSAGNITQTAARITWNPVSGQTKWWLEYRKAGQSWGTPIYNITNTFYTINGLEPGTEYVVYVGPYCGQNENNQTVNNENQTSTSFTTLDPACPVPTNVTAANVYANAATITWSSESTNTSYEVRYMRYLGEGYQYVETNSKSCTISGLQPNTEYEVWVVGYCGNNPSNHSEDSQKIRFTTLSSNSPCATKPTNLREENITSTSVKLRWTPSSGADNRWDVYYRLSTIAVVEHKEVLDQNSLTLTDLQPGSTYYYRMRSACYDDPGEHPNYGEYTDWKTFNTLPAEGIDNVSAKDESQKVIRDGQLLILMDGKTYNAQGAEIK